MTGQKISIYLVKFYRHWKHLHSNVFVMTQYLNITMYNKLLPDLNKQSSIRPSYPQQWYSHYTVTTQGNSFRRKNCILPILKSVYFVANVKHYKPSGSSGTPGQAGPRRSTEVAAQPRVTGRRSVFHVTVKGLLQAT